MISGILLGVWTLALVATHEPGQTGASLLLFFLAAAYLAPALIAESRPIAKATRWVCLGLAILAGWTVLGWVVALIVAAVAPREEPA